MDFFNPLYFLSGLSVIALLAWAAARLVPFYRRQLFTEQATRLTPLDGLRGILCLGVLYHHASVYRVFAQGGPWTLPDSRFFAGLGASAVALFFCITGFLFWSKAISAGGVIEPAPFLRARWFRIVPLYWFSCAAAILLIGRQVHWNFTPDSFIWLKMAAFGLRPWEPFRDVPLHLVNAGVTWTLPLEWAFYLVLPAIASNAIGLKWLRVPLIFLAAYLMFGTGWYLYFLPGILAAHAARDTRLCIVVRHPVATLICLLAVAALPFIFNYHSHAVIFPVLTLAFIPIACGNSLFGLLNLAGLRLLGIVSYSIYLLHGLVLYAGIELLKPYCNEANRYWLVVLSLAAVVFFCCLLTYRWVEYPPIQFEARWRRRSRTAAAVRPLDVVPVPVAMSGNVMVAEPATT